jgi:aspartyl-tRNA(Asn)/glutamyl-tRNA(Gln) amidotransferase subunit C
VSHAPSEVASTDSEKAPGLTRADVAHLAHLARLDLSHSELDRFRNQLAVILDAVAAVGEVATPEVEPTSHAVPLTNVFREDEPRPGLTRAQALDQAPAAEDGRFRVPQILGEEQ